MAAPSRRPRDDQTSSVFAVASNRAVRHRFEKEDPEDVRELASPAKGQPTRAGRFAQSVEAASEVVHTRIDETAPGQLHTRRSRPRRRVLGLSAAGASLAAAAAAVAFLTVGSPGSGTGVEDAAAAVKRAATVTAAFAGTSGSAVVRITHNGELWAGTTIRWHDADLSVSSDAPQRQGRAGSKLLVVDGNLYGVDPRDGAWTAAGKPENIDPGSGTTPAEYLAAVREDVGGATLRRITAGMTGLTTGHLGNGSTVYHGAVQAGLLARETGFKEGQQIRVLPFGYVAYGKAANPSAPLDAAITVGAGGMVHVIAVTWGTGASTWSYTVTYSNLGATRPRSLPPTRGRSETASAEPALDRRNVRGPPVGPSCPTWPERSPGRGSAVGDRCRTPFSVKGDSSRKRNDRSTGRLLSPSDGSHAGKTPTEPSNRLCLPRRAHPPLLCAEKTQAACDRCRARVDAELGVDVLEMLPDRGRGDPQDLGDLGIGLPVSDPPEDLALARGQPELIACALEPRQVDEGDDGTVAATLSHDY
jgi:hypothetical protein